MTHTLYHPYIPPPPAVDHDWVRESAATRVYRCLVCGSRCCITPEDVSITCAEIAEQQSLKRARGRNSGYRGWKAP